MTLIVSLPLCLSTEPQSGPPFPSCHTPSAPRALTGVVEQGDGPCPLASGLAEVGPVLPSTSAPAFVGTTSWDTRDQTIEGALQGLYAAPGVTRMPGHICNQTLCISTHFHVLCCTNRAGTVSRGKVIIATQACAPLCSSAFLPKSFVPDL